MRRLNGPELGILAIAAVFVIVGVVMLVLGGVVAVAPAASVTVTVKAELPTSVGVPVIWPFVNVRPAGSEPVAVNV